MFGLPLNKMQAFWQERTEFLNRRIAIRQLTREQFGRAPGELIHVGKAKESEPVITIIDFNSENISEIATKSIEFSFPFRDKNSISWINIDGLHRIDLIQRIGDHFGIHKLSLQDVLNVYLLPKVQIFDTYILVIIKLIEYNQSRNTFDIEQVSFVLGNNFVLSFQEKQGDVFESIRERLRAGTYKVRKNGADYLTYCLIDAVVDHYFLMMEKLEEVMFNLEKDVYLNPEEATLHKMYALKNELTRLRRPTFYVKELLNSLSSTESPLISKKTHKYFRDALDHTIQTLAAIDTLRDNLNSLFDVYLSLLGHKTNEIMKFLTLVASIFIPLTFMAGIYGMNFKYMPELEWRYSYFILLGAMGCISLALMQWFRSKKWL